MNKITGEFDNSEKFDIKLTIKNNGQLILFDKEKIKSLDVSDVDTSDITDMSQTFEYHYQLASLDLSNFNTSNVTTMNCMFFGCRKLEALNLSSFDTSNVTDMNGMFHYCESLNKFDLSNFSTSKVTEMDAMFYDCKTLTYLDISSFDFSNLKYCANIFTGCKSLSNLKFGKNLKISIDLQDCPLTHKSALSVINGLANVEELQYITFSERTYETLTDDEIKKAKNKNWNILNN